jgi:transcriptional regulator GlxA family with amidase domain
MVVYPDVQILDVTGPLEVFARTARWLVDQAGAASLVTRSNFSRRTAASCAAPQGWSLSSGARSRTCDVASIPCSWREVSADAARRAIACWSGGFAALLLACAASRRCVPAPSCSPRPALLDGRRATTHWGACRELAEQYPQVAVEADPIFVRDGRVYTSAGVTAGMDLALALVEEDHGREVALAVATGWAVAVQRPADGSGRRPRPDSRAPSVDRRASRGRPLGGGARAARRNERA